MTLTTMTDVYRTAKLLVDRHDAAAPNHATTRADKLMDRGNMEGQAVWLRVNEAVEAMSQLSDRPATGVRRRDLKRPAIRAWNEKWKNELWMVPDLMRVGFIPIFAYFERAFFTSSTMKSTGA